MSWHEGAIEFRPDLIEPRGWRIKGVGMHGSDVDVISLAQYEELVQLYRTNMAILGNWANSALRRKDLLQRLLDRRDNPALLGDIWAEVEQEVLR